MSILKKMAHSIGFEPTTFAFGGQRSNPAELRMRNIVKSVVFWY